jgi:putative endopeptidase
VTTLIADLFTSGIDEMEIKAGQAASIKPYIDEINGIKTVEDAFRVAERQKAKGLSSAFFKRIGGNPDLENSAKMTALISHGGFDLPMQYYMEDNPVLNAYFDATRAMMELGLEMTLKDAHKMAAIVVNVEKQLAAVALNSETEQRNATQANNRYQYTDLPKAFPGVPWDVISEEIGLTPQEFGKVTVDCPRCFTRLGKLVRETPLENIKAYLLSSFLKSATPFLGNEFTIIEQEFVKV